MSAPSHPRLLSIQRLRGVAALLVVFVHAIDLAERAPDGAVLVPLWIVNDLGASGVDLFFVLSGFVMTLGFARFTGPGGWRRFLAARAVRILPLYWLLTLAMIGITVMMPDLASTMTAIFVLPLTGGAFAFPPLWVGWTLAFEAGFYLMVAVALASGRRMALVALVMLAALAGMLLQPSGALAQVLLNPIGLEFGFGVLICLAYERGLPRWIRTAPMLVGVALLMLPRALWPELIFTPAAGGVIEGTTSLARVVSWGAPWALILLSAVASDRSEQRQGPDPLLRLGNASYALYLSHALIFAAAERWQPFLHIDAFAVVAAMLSTSILLGLAVHHWVERPLARALRPGPGVNRRHEPQPGLLPG